MDEAPKPKPVQPQGLLRRARSWFSWAAASPEWHTRSAAPPVPAPAANGRGRGPASSPSLLQPPIEDSVTVVPVDARLVRLREYVDKQISLQQIFAQQIREDQIILRKEVKDELTALNADVKELLRRTPKRSEHAIAIRPEKDGVH